MPLRWLSLLALFAGAPFAQDTAPGSANAAAKFELADVHVSPPSVSYHERTMSGGLLPDGRYDLRRATMLNLITSAWGVAAEKVLGGPNWLDMDRFDIRAKPPSGTTLQNIGPMLQALLAERFRLAVHKDTKPVPAFALTAGKRPQLKQSDGTGSSGCRPEMQNSASEGTTPSTPALAYSCRNMTMAQFAADLARGMAQDYTEERLVADQTGISGAWDFTFRYTPRSAMNVVGVQAVTLFDAIDKQLGLRLEPAMVPMPVIVVDSVNRTPTENPPGLEKAFPDPPAEFEVATVKPTAPGDQAAAGMATFALGTRVRPLAGGRVNAQGTLRGLIRWVWGLNDVMIIGLPPFADTDSWEIVGKAPGEIADIDTLSLMLKSLLMNRFKLAFHLEDRPIMAFTLTAAKPKLTRADPALRTGCQEGPPTLTKSDVRDTNPILGRLLTCRNTSMSDLAYLLFHGMASGYVKSPVLDATGLQGGWDFTLNFSDPTQISGGDSAASDPSGTVSLPDAMEKQIGVKMQLQKRPVQVLIIDHLERTPTDN